MSYYEKRITAGEVVEIKKYYSGRQGIKGGSRSQWENPTPEKVQQVNERKAVDKLRWLLFSNFQKGDGHITLTYKRKTDPEDAKAELAKFLRTMRARCKKAGTEFRYIVVTEYKSTRVHHHLIVEKAMFDLIGEVWTAGAVRITYITGHEHLAALASYLVKETAKTAKDGLYHKRWNASKNLRKWKETIRKVRAGAWRNQPNLTKKIKGKTYYLDKTVGDGAGVESYEDLMQRPCQFYRLYPYPTDDA